MKEFIKDLITGFLQSKPVIIASIKEKEVHMEDYHARLKPDTPWQIRRRIRQLERETDRMYAWMYRIGIAMEVIAMLALLACAVHFAGKFL